ncbi:hypothetical protein UY3_08014 [Chelonia mydas]|uniref:Uncharacterized protein n=1 Tax=Chelonia mydas TaxID=8469 RepID=M7BRX4_CHEMY|nr:hypothetical protein UY3_08014 [Chelonia mydas]
MIKAEEKATSSSQWAHSKPLEQRNADTIIIIMIFHGDYLEHHLRKSMALLNLNQDNDCHDNTRIPSRKHKAVFVFFSEFNRANPFQIRNLSYMNSIAEVNILKSTYHGVFSAVSRQRMLSRRLRLRFSFWWNTRVDESVLSQFIVSILDTIN